MNLQVLGQLVDTLGQNGDLDLGGTGVGSVGTIGLDDRGLLLFQHHSVFPPFKNILRKPRWRQVTPPFEAGEMDPCFSHALLLYHNRLLL